MLRTKKDVDRHVQEIFRKLPDEQERITRCCKIAELYYQVGDYESAKRYLSRYLELKKDAKAHRLMGQVYEALGQKDSALVHYKMSYEMDTGQDLIMKVCEIMADPDVEIDVSRAKYWMEKAENQYPRHKIIFQLKEKIMSVERPSNNDSDLENLMLAELSARPSDVQLRIRLLKYYMEKSKYDEAYKHASDIEATNIHRDNLNWYQVLCDLLLKCKVTKHLNWSFWILYVSCLERCASLSLKEQGNTIKRLSEPIQAVYNFDQHLFEGKAQSFSSFPSLTENIFTHLWGQLNFHLACLLLQNTKREQNSWSEAGRLSAPLLLTAMHIKPIDLSASWASNLDNTIKTKIQVWYREGSYRCSQAAHILQEYSKGNQKKLLDDIGKFCLGSWRERVYQRIFVNRIHQKIKTSYFTNNNATNPPLRFISQSEIKRYDEAAEEVWPMSLHHQVWPVVNAQNSVSHYGKHNEPQPFLMSHLFPELPLSVYNLNQASPVTLNRLDIDAFLNAAVLCSSAVIEEQQSNQLIPERLPKLPADLTPPLCSPEQEKWWKCVHKIYLKENLSDGISEVRQQVQRGLEVVRCIGNHGLHPNILVHLARIFSYRASNLKSKCKESSDIPALEARSELYWSALIPLLERLRNNQSVRTSNIKLFDYQGREMNHTELTRALEEGKLLLAKKLTREKLYEQAIESLQSLKCPEASFEQGKIYKKLADETINKFSKENLTSEMRSQHIIILSKARNCFYLTLDRLRSPDADPNHSLNGTLSTYITAIENELKRIDPDTIYNENNINDCEDASDVSYSSAHSDDQIGINHSHTIMHNHSQITPVKSQRKSFRKSSTPRIYPSCNEVHEEVRPSPERLDAQLRQLIHAIESLKEQSKEQNSAILSKLDDLIKVHSQKETEKPKTVQKNVNRNLEDELYQYGDEEYREYAAGVTAAMSANIRSSISQNMFPPQPPRQPYSPLVYPQAPTMPIFPQGIGYDPSAQTLPSLYPLYPNQLSHFYPRPVEPPLASLNQMSENIIQQQLFSQPNRLSQNMMSDYSNVQSSNAYMPLQNIETSKYDYNSTNDRQTSISGVTAKTQNDDKSASLNLSASGDIRKSVTFSTSSALGTSNSQLFAPHNYQISMPSSATILTTVNLNTLTSSVVTTTSPVKPNITSDGPSNSLLSTGSHDSSVELVPETDHDPIPDFAPIIPLPAEVPVNTGEEDEETLFCARAKLYRFIDKEWKERGLGNVKLLRNKEGKVRLLMRREQILKICANHMLRPDMELKTMPNTDKAYMWFANDFADEELKLEKLCIRFKTAEEGSSFKEQFDKAKNSLPDSPEKITNSSNIAKNKNDSSSLPQEMNQLSNSSALNGQKSESKTLESVGGFTFSQPPIIKKADASEIKTNENAPKPSPFANLNFTKSDNNSTSVTFSFGNTAQRTSSDNKAANSVFSTRPEMSDSKNSKDQKTFNEPKPLAELFKPAVGSWECKDCYTRNNAGTTNCAACQAPSPNVPLSSVPVSKPQSLQNKSLAERFKPPPGSWSCTTCYIQNASNNSYCVACDNPKDPSLPPKPKTGGFNLGPSSEKSNFTFGINPAQATKESGFTFQLSSNTTSTPPVPFFGGNNTPNTSGYALRTPPKSSPEKSFDFGSPGKSFDFHFQNKTPVKSPERAETSDDEVTESEDVYFAPVIPLPDKVEVTTGEENENVLYCHRAKLFKYDTKTKEWKERGLGDIKLLQHKENKKLRLIMRRDQVLKLCLNHAVNESLEINSKDDKTWLWSAGDYSEGEVQYLQFACRFKTAEIAQNFKKSIDDALQMPKNLTQKSNSPEIEVVYELKVSEDDKAAARKLRLPENFYAYKQKDECPGCIGCTKEPSKPLLQNDISSDTPSNLTTKLFNGPSKEGVAAKSLNSVTANQAGNTSNTPISTSSVFSFGSPSTKTIFGKDNNTVSEAKSTSFVFGSSSSQGVPIDSTSSTLPLDNLSICSPTPANKTSDTKNIFSGTGSAANSANIFGSSTPVFGATTVPPFSAAAMSSTNNAKSIFDVPKPSSTIFGSFNNTSPKNIFGGGTVTSTNTSGSVFGSSQSSNLFAPSTQDATKSTPTTTISSLKSNGMANTSLTANEDPLQTPQNCVFGENTNTPKLTFGNKSNVFGNINTETTNVFDKKSSEKPEKKSEISFLPTDNAMSFSFIAAQTKPDAQPAFKADPTFTFEGAGSSVFGRKTTSKNNTKNTLNENKDKNDEEEDDKENDNENGEEHDPHFEPIVPLPDAIEVKTGEEEENKLFCERAKLYRYDFNTKEWKERGVGDMKILHHTDKNTYRLLLRREQVHKVVCNLLITPDLKLCELNSSDRAWNWAGMNYAEDTPSLENLAVRFKSPELAQQFKRVVDKVQASLMEKQNQGSKIPTTTEATHNNEESYEEEYCEGDEYGYYDEDEEDNDDQIVMFDAKARLYTSSENEESWESLGVGWVRVVYDSEIFGARILFEADETGELLTDNVISMDTEMKHNGGDCIWAATDYALNPPVRRNLKATFYEVDEAVKMLNAFKEGHECAANADIRD